MAKKVTCAYCGRERPLKHMIPSQFKTGYLRHAYVCKSDMTTCLRIRAGAVFERNARLLQRPACLSQGAQVTVLPLAAFLRLDRAELLSSLTAALLVLAGVEHPGLLQLGVRTEFLALLALMLLHWVFLWVSGSRSPWASAWASSRWVWVSVSMWVSVSTWAWVCAWAWGERYRSGSARQCEPA